MPINQNKITHYLTLINKATLEAETTGRVSKDTADELETIESTLTPQEIRAIYTEWEKPAGDQPE